MKPLLLLPKISRAALRRGIGFVNASPARKKYLAAIVRKLGLYNAARGLYTKLISVAYRPQAAGSYRVVHTRVAPLTPRAREIYVRLNAAIERNQRVKD